MNDRKYFDYELAYEMYERVNELFNEGGIDLVNQEFNIEYETQDNGYIVVKDELNSYNAEVYLIDRNFDTSNEEKDWYVSGEVDMYSYSGGNDSIYINNEDILNSRLEGLINYAKVNDYTINDTEREYNSLINTIKKLKGKCL